MPTLNTEIKFNLYFYEKYERLIITDIDGTITTSDHRGVVRGVLGLKVHHEGIVRLLDEVAKRGYKVMYLTARSLGFDTITRNYLYKASLINQKPNPFFCNYFMIKELQNVDDKFSVPDGPVFLSPKTVSETAIEHLTSGPALQKAHTLGCVLELFKEGARIVDGAYGNAESDVEAYRDEYECQRN